MRSVKGIKSLELVGLTPHTLYNASIQLRHTQGIMYSDAVYLHFTTEDDSKLYYHASDKIVGIILDRSRSHDAALGSEIRIGRVNEIEAGCEQSKMADDKLVAMHFL